MHYSYNTNIHEKIAEQKKAVKVVAEDDSESGGMERTS